MEFSPRKSSLSRKLYRNRLFVVILVALGGLVIAGLAAELVAQELVTEYGRKAPIDKGPRALGLIQLSPNGKKARLIPIVIMMDGKFYDAGSYKADPVPMALDFDTIYEGFHTGVSQGLFKVTQPGQLNHVWIAEGTWLAGISTLPDKNKKYAPPVIEEADNGEPVLHRRVPKSDSDSDNKDKSKDQQKPATPSTVPAATAGGTTTPNTSSSPGSSTSASGSASGSKASDSTTTAPPTAPTSTSAESSRSSAPNEVPIEDPNRPRLRRGRPDPTAHHEPFANFDDLDAIPGQPLLVAGKGKAGAKAAKNAAVAPDAITIPAISDAGGPDPRPYTYDLKPAEQAVYRNQMLELASTLLPAPAKAASRTASAHRKESAHESASKSGQPVFDEVNLRIFDLSNSNEPVLVLSAATQPPAGATGKRAVPQEITLIARTNLEGELQKLFFSQTDSQHLDVTPRMQLIDAVDADGDGRGELLFRRTFDDGSAYAIYRVTADGLWPLYEGTP